ncbi:MAG: hypothetical protein ACRCV6_10435, partial [Formosimonas sp.]
MSDIYVVDNDFIDKLAKVDQLDLLRIEGKSIVVTDKVYEEIEKGALDKGVPSAIKARDWLIANRNEPWLEVRATTQTQAGKGMGERSIVDLINERKAIDPSVNYTILTDNKKDLNKISNLLNEPQKTPIFMVREFANDLAHKNVLSVAEYNALEQKTLDAKGFSEPRPQFSSPPPAPVLSQTNLSGNDFDLTPDALKQQHAEVIAKVDTFKPQGVSKQAALNYLETTEGKIYSQRLLEASPDTSTAELRKRAVGHLMSGSELPRMEIINEPLVKIVPQGQSVSPHSPFWAKESDLNAAISEGKNLSKHFGLPVYSEALAYDVYKITPKAPTEVFVGRLAPTVELDGLIHKSGGAIQYLTPNRKLYEDAVFVKSVENRVIIPHQKELQIPSDLHNPAIQTIGGLERRELVAMHETLIAKHGYSSAQANEAVHARVTVQTALNDHLAGKTPTADLTHSQQVLQQTASVLKDTPHQYNINQQITATNQMHNGASNEIITHTLNATPKPLQPSSPFHQAHTNPAPEIKLNLQPVEHGPPNGFSTHRAWEAEQRAAQLELSRTINQPVIEAEARTRAMQTVQRQELNAARQASLEVGGLGKAAGRVIAPIAAAAEVVSIGARVNNA